MYVCVVCDYLAFGLTDFDAVKSDNIKTYTQRSFI